MNDTNADDIDSLKALTQRFMNEVINGMSALARDNIKINSMIKPLMPSMSAPPH